LITINFLFYYHFRKAVSLKKTYGGRLAFHEKLIHKRAKQYCENLSNFLLPLIEIFYLYNILKFARYSDLVVENYEQMIDQKLKVYKKESDQYYTLLFYKAIMSSFKKNYKQAFDFFKEVVKK